MHTDRGEVEEDDVDKVSTLTLLLLLLLLAGIVLRHSRRE